MTILVILRWLMTWAATQAKANFSEVLDKAETSGPQRVTRRKREFFLITGEDLAERTGSKVAEGSKPFRSAWDALGGPEIGKFDFEIPRSKSKARWVKF
jgi:prevent-host-death family protein